MIFGHFWNGQKNFFREIDLFDFTSFLAWTFLIFLAYTVSEVLIFISRDPSYFEYVDKIGQHFFGLPAPQRPQGMFSGLLDSIFSAMNEDDSEEGETNNSVQMDLDWFCYFFLFWGLKVWIMQKSFVIK